MVDPSERIRELEAEVEGLKTVEVEAAQDIARLFAENQRMLPVVEAAERETAAEDDVTEAEGEAFMATWRGDGDVDVDVVCAQYDRAEDDARGIRRAAVHVYRIADDRDAVSRLDCIRDTVSRLARIQAVYDAAVKWRPTVSIDTMTDSEWTLAAAVIAAEEK